MLNEKEHENETNKNINKNKDKNKSKEIRETIFQIERLINVDMNDTPDDLNKTYSNDNDNTNNTNNKSRDSRPRPVTPTNSHDHGYDKKQQKRKLTQDTIVAAADAVALKKNIEEENNKEAENTNGKFHYLYQSDYVDGTHRIEESGNYMIMEDIVFDYYSPIMKMMLIIVQIMYSDDGDIYGYPKVSQKDLYPGAYEFHAPYLLCFFCWYYN